MFYVFSNCHYIGGKGGHKIVCHMKNVKIFISYFFRICTHYCHWTWLLISLKAEEFA